MLGRDALADGLEQPELQGRREPWRCRKWVAFEEFGIKKVQQKRFFIGRQDSKRFGVSKRECCNIPVSEPGKAKDACRVRRQNVRSVLDDAAGLGFGTRQQGDVEGAAKPPRLLRTGPANDLVRFLQVAHGQESVNPRQKEPVVDGCVYRRVKLASQQVTQKPIEYRWPIAAVGKG